MLTVSVGIRSVWNSPPPQSSLTAHPMVPQSYCPPHGAPVFLPIPWCPCTGVLPLRLTLCWMVTWKGGGGGRGRGRDCREAPTALTRKGPGCGPPMSSVTEQGWGWGGGGEEGTETEAEGSTSTRVYCSLSLVPGTHATSGQRFKHVTLCLH